MSGSNLLLQHLKLILEHFSHKCCVAPLWFKFFHSESFLIQFRVWNNSLSWFMCSTSRTSISPIRITSHRSICCNQHLLSSNNSNKSYVQQSSTIHIEPNLYKCCGCHGVMFSELSNPAGMPRLHMCTVLYNFIDVYLEKYAAVHTGMQNLG